MSSRTSWACHASGRTRCRGNYEKQVSVIMTSWPLPVSFYSFRIKLVIVSFGLLTSISVFDFFVKVMFSLVVCWIHLSMRMVGWILTDLKTGLGWARELRQVKNLFALHVHNFRGIITRFTLMNLKEWKYHHFWKLVNYF